MVAGSAQTTTIPANFARPVDAVDTSAPGFKVRTVQATSTGGTLATTIARAEAQLAGTLVDPATSKPYVNIANASIFGADGYYNEASVIDYEQGGASSFGLTIPGIPGTVEEQLDNIAMEAYTYIVLQPGAYSMVINSDDGFKLTAGQDPRDQFNSIVLGLFDAGRGAADSVINFSVTAAGTYGFRLVYFEGGGGANVSWYSAPTSDPTAKLLVNDLSMAGAMKSYRQVKGAASAVIDLASPGPGQTAVAPKPTFTYRIVDGSPNPVAVATVELFLDGAKVAATVDKSGSKTMVTYTPANLLASLSTHKVKLVYGDTSSPVIYKTNELQFTVAEYANLILPQAPIISENFDSFPEQTDSPQGYNEGLNKWTYKNWTIEQYTDVRTPGWDLDDPNSDAYLGWVLTSKQRVLDMGTAGKWEGPRRVSNVAEQYVNGQRVTSLMSTNFFYAESDQRGGSQVQYLYSPDYDMTGKNNLYVYYHSMYEQNQDSIASVEYSIDQGKTWLPIVYMIDKDDLKLDAAGAIDGYATLSAAQSDTAKYVDPQTAAEIGLTYGSFVGASSNTWSTLSKYISGRINDDATESKRVEFFPIPKADNQSKVRFRFAQAGTGSWYFGIDNFAIYSYVPPTAVPAQPVVTAPAEASPIAKQITVNSSAFKGYAAADTHALSIWQISSGPAFTPSTGFSATLRTITSATSLTSVSFPADQLIPGSTYYISVQYQDQGGMKSNFSEPVAVKIAALPTPIALETFETTADYSVPTGWTASNMSDATGVADPADINSDTYANWVVVPFTTLQTLGGGRADYPDIATGKSLYAESDNRSGNQIQVIVTPDYNLAGKNNIWLAFKSSYVQNQDNIGVAEYSIDKGVNWLPIVYLVNDKASNTDVVRNADGTIDAVKTLTTTAGDIAKVIDPVTGARVDAGKYADFILAKPIESLGPYISGRIDDDKAESRRYERYRLTSADNQATVRLRFVQAGTGSWWWGLDDIGLYSVSEGATTTGPTLKVALSAGKVVVSWPASATGFKLQSATALGGSWTDVAGAQAVGTEQQVTVTPTGTAFYRLIK